MLEVLKKNRTGWQSRLRTLMVIAVVAFVSFAAGTSERASSSARADVRRSKPREAFLSGAGRSLVVLQEISATLKRMETRLDRIERSASELARQRTMSRTHENPQGRKKN